MTYCNFSITMQFFLMTYCNFSITLQILLLDCKILMIHIVFFSLLQFKFQIMKFTWAIIILWNHQFNFTIIFNLLENDAIEMK